MAEPTTLSSATSEPSAPNIVLPPSQWLRWATLNGELLPTAQEIAEQERQEKELVQQQVEQERQEKELIKSQLRQVVLNLLQEGMGVEQVARLTGLAETQVEQIHSLNP